VPEQKVSKNRMHLDIETSDIDAEAARLEHLGRAALPGTPMPSTARTGT